MLQRRSHPLPTVQPPPQALVSEEKKPPATIPPAHVAMNLIANDLTDAGTTLHDQSVLAALEGNGADGAETGGGDEVDSLTRYLREIRRTPLFTPEEEFATAQRARAGDFAARQ